MLKYKPMPEHDHIQQLREFSQKIRDVEMNPGIPEYIELVESTSKEYGYNPLPYIEQILRASLSPRYLIAFPMNELQLDVSLPFSIEGFEVKTSDLTSYLPHSGEQQYPYFMYIANSLQEAEEKMRELGITPAQNSRNLYETGIIQPKTNTRLNRFATSRDN